MPRTSATIRTYSVNIQYDEYDVDCEHKLKSNAVRPSRNRREKIIGRSMKTIAKDNTESASFVVVLQQRKAGRYSVQWFVGETGLDLTAAAAALDGLEDWREEKRLDTENSQRQKTSGII